MSPRLPVCVCGRKPLVKSGEYSSQRAEIEANPRVRRGHGYVMRSNADLEGGACVSMQV